MILREGLTDRVARCLARHEHAVDRHGVPDGKGLVIACSAGVDSTALALVIGDLKHSNRLSGPIVLAHVHHGAHPDPEVHRARATAATRAAELQGNWDWNTTNINSGPGHRHQAKPLCAKRGTRP